MDGRVNRSSIGIGIVGDDVENDRCPQDGAANVIRRDRDLIGWSQIGRDTVPEHGVCRVSRVFAGHERKEVGQCQRHVVRDIDRAIAVGVVGDEISQLPTGGQIDSQQRKSVDVITACGGDDSSLARDADEGGRCRCAASVGLKEDFIAGGGDESAAAIGDRAVVPQVAVVIAIQFKVRGGQTQVRHHIALSE